MTMEAEEALLSKMGLDYQVLDSGCCGMAGSFGFEPGDRYDVSIQAAERVLLPSVREAAAETLVIANGFSCREQIAQTTDRRALHLAEVLHLALSPDRAAGGYPERLYAPETTWRPSGRAAIAAAAAGLLAAWSVTAWVRQRAGR